MMFFEAAPDLPTIILPFDSFSFSTEKLVVPLEPDFFEEVEELPKFEKFHVPADDLISATCGSVIVNERTSSFFENIRGIRFTPTVSSFAVRNGDLLNAGSSAMETF